MSTGISNGRHPQQRRAVVLPGLRVGSHPTRVVVPDHDDDPGADNRGESQKTGTPAAPGADVLHPDSAQGALNVPDVLFVKDRGRAGRGLGLTTQRLVRHKPMTSGLVGLTRCF